MLYVVCALSSGHAQAEWTFRPPLRQSQTGKRRQCHAKHKLLLRHGAFSAVSIRSITPSVSRFVQLINTASNLVLLATWC